MLDSKNLRLKHFSQNTSSFSFQYPQALKCHLASSRCVKVDFLLCNAVFFWQVTVGTGQSVVPEERPTSGEWAWKIIQSEVWNPS